MSKKKKQDQDDRNVPLLAIDQYMRLVKQIPRLSREEEVCLMQWVEQGRAEQGQPLPDENVLERARLARVRLVEGYQHFVIYIAKKYRRSCYSMELLDLISEGNLGLLRALAYHRSGEGYSLLTMVSRCVRQAIVEGLYSRESMVRLPKNVARDVEWLRQEQRQLEDYLGCEATVEQLAEQMKLSVRQVQDLLEWSAHQQVSSVEAIVGHSEEDEFRFMRWFEPSASNDQLRQDMLSQAVRQAVEQLPARQREVISLHYGLDGQTDGLPDWKEVGAFVGLSADSAAASEYVGRRKLRKALAPLVLGERAENEGQVA
jgi:RNA polymerase sigma factor (sigma-70 family)